MYRYALMVLMVQIFSATAAKILIASPSPKVWTDSHLSGALVFLKDSSKNSGLFFRLVDLKNRRLSWEHEIYRELVYYKDQSHFYSFASDTFMVGICFADPVEARQFGEILAKKRALYDPPLHDPKGDLDRITRKGKVDKAMIGKPCNFQHLSHVGVGHNQQLSLENVPEDWKAVFKQAGVTQKQLEHPETARVISDFIRGHEELAPPVPPRRTSKNVKPPEMAESRRSALSRELPKPRSEESFENSGPEPGTLPPSQPLPPPPQSKPSSPPPAPPQSKSSSPLPPPPLSNPPPSTTPGTQDPPRELLLESIRNAGIGSLRKMESPQKPSSESKPPTGLMAELLSKALEERHSRADE